jgi:pimeloyl-ACP methyl ester carboxylesterase
LLVLLPTLLALSAGMARPAAAARTALSRVAIGSRYVVITAPVDHGACTRAPLAGCRPGARLAPIRVLVGPPHLPASATSAAVPATCPPRTPQGAACGTVAVPLDRTNPASGTIPIFFALFAHTSPGPPQSAILVNFGGPGFGATTGFLSGFALSLFATNLDVHDLLLVDDRGRGLSGTIDCPAFQHGTAPFAQAEADCAAQLGPAASRYGTGDIAQDADAVRAALGYDKVDYYGGSYGGEDVSAYATRFGAHLRSLVLDAPRGTPGLDPLVYAHDQTQSESRMVQLACTYSPTCSADHPNPVADLDWLIGDIQAHPLAGEAYDANGNLVQVQIDEPYLLWYIIHNPTGNFASTGELVAAATSLRQGDPAPLLRLGAEGFFPYPGGDNGDPTVFSRGAQSATACVDASEAWNWHAAVPGRQGQYNDTVKQLPSDYFAPFSKAAATGNLFSRDGADCLWWQKPTPSSPVTPPQPTYPNVPTLVLDGDMDNQVPLEEVTQVAALFPGSTLVAVAEAGHETVFWTHCAENLASQFIETLQVGDISCTKTPETVFPAVGRFPLLAQDAVPAAIDPNGNNQIGTSERQVVTVAVAAVKDALQRSYIGFGADHCLRAGTFGTTYSPSQWSTTLTNCAFAQDVTVNGTVTWGAGYVGGADNSLVADLALSGPGTAGGTFHVEGTWLAPGPAGDFTVTGQLGGLNVDLLVPEA